MYKYYGTFDLTITNRLMEHLQNQEYDTRLKIPWNVSLIEANSLNLGYEIVLG